MPPPIPGVTVGDNPLYMPSDRVIGLAAAGMPPAGTLTRQFMNPIYDYNEEDDEPETDYAPDPATVWREKAGIINASPEDQAYWVEYANYHKIIILDSVCNFD